MNKQQKQALFKEWWAELPQGNVSKMKQKIMSGCYISYQVFYFWLNGRTEIPDIAMSVINQIVGEKIFDLNADTNNL